MKWFSFLFIVGFALWLRVPYLSRPLYYDEICRANPISSYPLIEAITSQSKASITLGVAVLSRALAEIFGNTELVLRSLPFICGMLLLVIGYRLQIKVSSRTTGILTAFIFSFFSVYASYSIEFKPYTLEACSVLALFLLFSRYVRLPTVTNLLLLFLISLAGLFLAAPLVFAFPALYGYLLTLSLRRRQHRSLIISLVAVLLAASLGHYLLILLPQIDDHLYRQANAGFPRGYGITALLTFALDQLGAMYSYAVYPVLSRLSWK